MRRLLTAFVLLSSFVAPVVGFAQAVPVPASRLALPREPTPNLGVLKKKLQAYHDCTRPDCYAPMLDRQADKAITYLRSRIARAAPGEKLAMVLDIDETSLSNWDEEKADDFGYIIKDSDAWIESRKAPAIAGTLRLYNEALSHGVAVFFITGRPELQRAATADNLTAAGYKGWAGLALRGLHSVTQTTTEYKSGERKKIVDAGYKIILSVGDQMSDLNGLPQAEYSVKLPNPFYHLP
jgi:acid phosphatase